MSCTGECWVLDSTSQCNNIYQNARGDSTTSVTLDKVHLDLATLFYR